jgi:ribonuclease HI
VFVSLKEQIIEYKVCFEFPTTNNISEYEALLAGLLLTDALNAYPLQAYSDS